MIDLKPCPFCGGEVQLCNIDGDGLGGFSYYYEVVCLNCGLSNKSIYANRDRVENAAIKHWNTRSIEDVLRKEIAQLQADNRSLVEQVNKVALQPNQEVIEWYQHPLYPDTSRCCIVECTDNCFYIAHHSDIDGWLNTATYEQLSNVKSWAYLPIGKNYIKAQEEKQSD